MDSMTELYCDESSGIIRDLRKSLMGKEGNGYSQDTVQEIFRGVHTLKANSSMMMFENLAALSYALESLLHCFRGEGQRLQDGRRFEKVISNYLDFFESELKNLAEGQPPRNTAQELQNEMKAYVEEVLSHMTEDEKKQYRERMKKPRRKIYYIASAADDSPEQKPIQTTDTDNIEGKHDMAGKEPAAITEAIVPEDAVSQKESISGEAPAAEKKAAAEKETAKRELSMSQAPSMAGIVTQVKKKKYMVSEEAREKIFQASRDILRIIGNVECLYLEQDAAHSLAKQMEALRKVQTDLEDVKKELSNTNFVPVARKMKILADEMSQKLRKPVTLLVHGEDTLVESGMREKISGALIHIIRNAIDHGIEDMETRERLGKPPMGVVKLHFFMQDGRLKITVKDDGRGIDTKKVLESARANHLLDKPEGQYTEKEIYSLMLKNGVTTSDHVGEYSGRGVGMDVIKHNVEKLGGKLKISSKKGNGTSIMMKF